MEISHASSIRFGWTQQERPDYKVKLKKEDVKDMEQAIPTDAFVKKVGKKLVGDEDSAPRFVLLSDAGEALGATKSETSEERIKRFRHNLLEQLIGYFKTNNPELLALKHPLSSEAALSGDDVEVSIGGKMDDPYPRHKDKSSTMSPMFTHWDYYNWPIISLQYAKPTNVMGGLPRVFDARQMANDEGKTVLDLVDQDKFKKKNYTSLLPPNTEVFEKYSIPFDPESEPILILNNTLEAGIAHGVTTVYPKEADKPVARPIHHLRVLLKKHQEEKASQEP